MKKNIKDYFKNFSAGYLIDPIDIFFGILFFPIMLLVYIISSPFILLSDYLNS